MQPPEKGKGMMRGRKAFTLIELLVVISVIALLMAILAPTLSKVRKQARAMVCRSNLRQWGSFFAVYAADNDGEVAAWSFPSWESAIKDPYAPMREILGDIGDWTYFDDCEDGVFRCPTAAKCTHTGAQIPAWAGPYGRHYFGGTFYAWCNCENNPGRPLGSSAGSYSANSGVTAAKTEEIRERLSWNTLHVQGRADIPIGLDGRVSGTVFAYSNFSQSPPPYEEMNVRIGPPAANVCINRHESGINMLFLDWSVRKVGLKELWTLKWNPQFDTSGPWTKAGGVQPGDWPEWMRNFRDY